MMSAPNEDYLQGILYSTCNYYWPNSSS